MPVAPVGSQVLAGSPGRLRPRSTLYGAGGGALYAAGGGAAGGCFIIIARVLEFVRA